MCRTSVYTGITVNTLALIDDSQRFPHRDRALRTGPDALLAADATDITILTCPGTRPLILTAYRHRCSNRHQLDQFLRTHFHALSAAMTFRTVDMADAVFDRNGTESAHRHAVTKTKTSESTGVRAAQETACRMAAGCTKINIALAGLLTGSLTARDRDLLLRNRGFRSQDRCNLTRTVHAADRT